jgi:hypothetical protein
MDVISEINDVISHRSDLAKYGGRCLISIYLKISA